MGKYKITIERLARERKLTVEEMEAVISERTRAGMNDPNPEKRAQWERIPHRGEMPTPEEWLKYVIGKMQKEGREDLLAGVLPD